MSANWLKIGYFAVKNWLNVIEIMRAILQFFVKFLNKIASNLSSIIN